MEKRFCVLAICAFLIAGMVWVSAATTENENESKLRTKEPAMLISEHQEDISLTQLHIPEQSEIEQNGYPENKYGETYGPDVKELDLIPDLLLVQNDAGVLGYIRVAELEGNSPKSPIDAEKYENVTKLNMYLEDGRTIVGEFYLSAEIMEEFFYE